MSNRIGDAPIEPQFEAMMNALAKTIDTIDEFFNGKGEDKKRETGFVLMVFPTDHHEGRCNYISNVDRNDVRVLLKEQLAYFEGQAEVKGRA